MKQAIGNIAILGILGIAVTCIIIFFQEKNYYYLVSGTALPLAVMVLFRQYCLGYLLILAGFVSTLIGYFISSEPYNHVLGVACIYIALFQISRWSAGMTGNYIERAELKVLDRKFVQALLESDFYKSNKENVHYFFQTTQLTQLPFYQIHGKNLINFFEATYSHKKSASSLTKEDLETIHAIAVLRSLSSPIIKCKEGLLSPATQLLINLLENHRMLERLKVDLTSERYIGPSTQDLIANSIKEYGPVSPLELEDYLSSHNE